MKQLLILSGKGGTGKTSITASFASLAKKAVLVDADVDAADLHLVIDHEVIQEHGFIAGQEAEINQQLCEACNTCKDLCRFDAVNVENLTYTIDSFACEGCGLCATHCPANAISMSPSFSGHWYLSETSFGPFLHAKLGIAADNSGKLVSVIRDEGKKASEKKNLPLIIIDGPPGIGCPVIASLTGCDLAMVVTEPTPSGLHDLKRVAELAKHFDIPLLSVVNKADLDDSMAEKIEAYCKEKGVKTLGRIPFDPSFVKAMVAKQSLVDYSTGAAAMAIKDIWRKVGYELELKQ